MVEKKEEDSQQEEIKDSDSENIKNEEDYNDALNRWARRSVRYSGDAPGTYRYCPNRPMPDDYLLPGATPFIWFGWNWNESPSSSSTVAFT